MSSIQKFKWFWAWEDEKEEEWLTQMARDGYHLESVDFPSIYVFTVGEPKSFVYRLDFNIDRKGYQEYLQVFRDAGWEHVGVYGSWQYFRTEAQPGESPEIFTDNDSKVQKYSRVMMFLVVFFPIYTILLGDLNDREGTFYGILTFVFFLLMVIYAYAMLMLLRRISQLKKKL